MFQYGKEKIAAIFLVAAILILLFPIRMNQKDGGRVRYKAILYAVTKIHQLTYEDEVKPYIDGVEVKIPGMAVY